MDGDKMNNEVINRHKRRWYEGETDSESSLNQAIENFNELLDNKMSPSVHTVEYTKPFEFNTDVRFKENILVSDISRQEQIKDQKLLHVKLNSNITSGSYIWWNNYPWLVSNEDSNAVQDHKTYTIIKCGVVINYMYDGTMYSYPIVISNLTLYADGSKELVNLTLSSAKYSIQISENDVTNMMDNNTRFAIRGRVFEISLVDDFTSDNIRTFTVCESVANSLDDLDNDIAWNEDSDIEDVVNPYLTITGNDVILIGDTTEYTSPNAMEWVLEENDALTIVLSENGRCKVKCKANSEYIGMEVKLTAYNGFGIFIDEKIIRIGGLF